MGLSLREAKGAIDEILAFAELERFASLELKHYSSGMASRLAYSVAFSAVREVLLIDEIFAVGDVAFKLKCEQRYLQLASSGRTVVVVSHDVGFVSTEVTRVACLNRTLTLHRPEDVTGESLARIYGGGVKIVSHHGCATGHHHGQH